MPSSDWIRAFAGMTGQLKGILIPIDTRTERAGSQLRPSHQCI